jgi:hypothetical protein
MKKTRNRTTFMEKRNGVRGDLWGWTDMWMDGWMDGSGRGEGTFLLFDRSSLGRGAV